MYRHLFLPVCILATAALLPAQNPMIPEAKAAYETIKTNIMKSAEKMPDSAYGFKASEAERSWGELMGHIADAQTRICSGATGEMKNANSSKLTAKGDLVNALKASFEVCDAAWASTNDGNAHSAVKMRNRDMTRLGMLIYNTTHDNESYGTMAVYVRLKNVVPPSSEGR